jgi:hypothetical protein
MSEPSGVVTFLVTDIEGSTRRWEADPELMRSALEAHDSGSFSLLHSPTCAKFSATGPTTHSPMPAKS